jgi:DNA uptake protein ComE-like DNA-binding protein
VTPLLKKIRNALLQCFTFSRKESIGALTLWCILIGLHILPSIIGAQTPSLKWDTAQLASLQIQLEQQLQERELPASTTPASISKQKNFKTSVQKIANPKKLEVNHADSADWEALPAIGPVLASRIVRYRNRLGGFYRLEQLKEVYGIEDSTFAFIQRFLKINSEILNKIDLNSIDEQHLAKHPYFNQKLAKTIVRYRNNHGPFSQIHLLVELGLVDEEFYRKIEHYLVVK